VEPSVTRHDMPALGMPETRNYLPLPTGKLALTPKCLKPMALSEAVTVVTGKVGVSVTCG